MIKTVISQQWELATFDFPTKKPDRVCFAEDPNLSPIDLFVVKVSSASPKVLELSDESVLSQEKLLGQRLRNSPF